MQDKDIIKVMQDSQLQIQNLQEALDKLLDRNAELVSQNETWVRVSESDESIEMSAVAKILNYKGLGRNKIFEILRELGILRYNNEPYQQYIERGYFDIIVQEVQTSYGTITNRKPVVKQKGVDYIRKTLDKMGFESASR